MKIAYVALGSNLINPEEQIKTAFFALEQVAYTRVIKKSSLYQTSPIGYDAIAVKQIPDFINATVKLETDLTPGALLEALFDIENHAGRKRPYPNAPRLLDCDLLLYENLVMNTEKLILPHPRMHTRGFVLLPLLEIEPQLSIPNHGKIARLITPDLISGVKILT